MGGGVGGDHQARTRHLELPQLPLVVLPEEGGTSEHTRTLAVLFTS